MTADVTEVLHIDNLTKYFTEDDSLVTRLHPGRSAKTVHAVENVSFTVQKEETLGLVGESGCGKSTLARSLLKLIEPTSGNVYYHGTDLTEYGSDQLRDLRSEIQMIFQDPFASLNPRSTVRRTLTAPMKLHGIGDSKEDRNRRAVDLVEQVGLSKEQLDRYPHEFSGGQRQRIAIARALSVEPSLIVADEPVSALDVSVQAQILNLLEGLREQRDLSILFISHDLSVIRHISDRIAVMYLGQIVETGPTNTLFENPNHPYTEALLSSIPIPNPQRAQTRDPLEGEVPTPIDPPRGCRFHPRCPKIIPPDDWPDDQTAYRRVFQFRTAIKNGEIRPKTVRSQLAANDSGPVDDDRIRERIYEEYITQADDVIHDTVSLSDDPKNVVEEAINLLVDGDRNRALGVLNDAFESVCETEAPKMIKTGDNHCARCHLNDPTKTEQSVETAELERTQ